jgi:hypothetical protein
MQAGSVVATGEDSQSRVTLGLFVIDFLTKISASINEHLKKESSYEEILSKIEANSEVN